MHDTRIASMTFRKKKKKIRQEKAYPCSIENLRRAPSKEI